MEAKSKLIERTFMLFTASVGVHSVLTYVLYRLFSASEVFALIQDPFLMIPVILGIFGASMLAGVLAHRKYSRAAQLTGLGAYIIVQAFLFLPLVHEAVASIGMDSVLKSGVFSLALFAGLTAYVIRSKADFTGLGKYVWWATIGALGVAVLGLVTGFQLGIVFSGAMVVLGSTWILYDASKLVHRYDSEDDYVGATLDLFSSFAFTAWYVLRSFR